MTPGSRTPTGSRVHSPAVAFSTIFFPFFFSLLGSRCVVTSRWAGPLGMTRGRGRTMGVTARSERRGRGPGWGHRGHRGSWICTRIHPPASDPLSSTLAVIPLPQLLLFCSFSFFFPLRRLRSGWAGPRREMMSWWAWPRKGWRRHNESHSITRCHPPASDFLVSSLLVVIPLP